MSDTVQPKRRKLGGAHWAVLTVWGIVTAWLLIAMITSVVDALFFGDGPAKTEQVEAAPAEATGALQPPTR